MKPKPKGPKYRYLHAFRGSIWLDLTRDGKRHRRDLETGSWEEAAGRRDSWLADEGISIATPRGPIREAAPTLAEFAKRYLDEDTGHLAPTTRADRTRELGPEGPILPLLGGKRLDALTPADLRRWWGSEIEGKGRSVKSGRIYLDALAAVFAYAKDLDLVDGSPVPVFRETLRRKMRTQRGRAESVAGRHVKPIENVAHLGALLAAAEAESRVALVAVLLGLDAGLRKGEAWGLRWQDVGWATDEGDPGRCLRIEQSRSRGGDPGPPKSGRTRTVALSRRLRAALEMLHAERTRRRDGYAPEPEALVLAGIEYRSFQDHVWPRILRTAGLTGITYKDLRDTFASWLITCGVPLGYVSRQLGHADLAITATHYARWAGGDDYRDPLPRLPGELPADFLARLPAGSPQKSPQSNVTMRNDSGTVVGRTGLEPVTSAV